MDDYKILPSDLGGNVELPNSDIGGNLGAPVSITPEDKIKAAVDAYMKENPIPSGEDGITPHIGENGNWYLGDTDTGEPSRGTDGYTPVIGVDYGTQEEIAEISKQAADALQTELDAKLDKPETAPEVGEILKVTAVNDDGTFTCEWADSGLDQVKDDIADKLDYKNPQELTADQKSAIQSAIGILSVEEVLF